MTANKPVSTEWIDPDDAPEWTDEMFAHAEISIGGKVIRPATGVITKGGVRAIGRPALGDRARKPVTMRLPPHVVEYFRSTGPGWQRRVADLLEAHVVKNDVRK
jgi:uncharacterized protein (DUF4415 family)